MGIVKAYLGIVTAIFSVTLSGCVVMSSTPLAEAVTVVSNAVTGVANMAPNVSRTAILHKHDVLRNVCIELNPQVTISDFLPELQSDLKKFQVESRIYDAGMEGSDCDAILYYAVQLDWAAPMFSDNEQEYISGISLILKKNGKLLAAASYTLDGMKYDKWASTSHKLSPLVQRIFTGNTVLSGKFADTPLSPDPVSASSINR